MESDSLKKIIYEIRKYEIKGIRLYEKLSQNKSDIFSQINNIRKSGVELLEKTFPFEFENEEFEFFIGDTKEEKLAAAISYEAEIAKRYEILSQKVKDENIKDMIFRFWATSANEYLENLKKEQKDDDDRNHEKNMFKYQNSIMQSFGELQELAKKIASDEVAKEDILKFINNPNISFIGGIVAGGFLGTFINQIMKDDNKENKQERM